MSSPASVFELSTRVLEARRPRAPTSQPQARPINQRPKTPQELLDSFMDWYQNGLPVYPSYLKGTVYEQLANEQYKIYCKKRSTDSGIPRNPSQTQSNALDYPKSLRAMSTLQIQDTLTERLVANDLRLPTAWNPDQKGEFVEMSQDHLQLSYEGIGKKDSDIAAVRANFPMRHQCGIYYFEVEIISKGVDGHIGIGFCWPSSKLNRLPGWEVHSWGYHGDDGHIFSGPETSRKYGPKFSTGDIIGCGVDFRDMTAFYTKNGVHLGTAFKNITGNILYPFVGFKTKGEKIRANFGSQKYKYDIEQYIKSERTQMQDSVYQSTPLCLDPARPAKVDRPSIEESKSKDVMNALVLDYLDYYGYYNTAQALKASSVKSKLAGDEAVLTKTESADTHIRKAVVNGHVEEVIEKCEALYPGVFEKNPQILFRLRCQVFVEMVRAAQEVTVESRADRRDQMDVASSKRSVSDDELVESDGKRRKKDHSDPSEGEKEVAIVPTNLLEKALVYGERLKSMYRHSAEDASQRKQLTDVFSVLAYINPSQEDSVRHLFSQTYKETLASDLNSVILLFQNHHATSSLERLYSQLSTTIYELTLEGNGKAAMVRPDQDCL